MKIGTAVSRSSPWGKKAATRIAVIAVVYFLAHELAFVFPGSHRILTAVWAAGGIGVAALLLSPRRQWPAILAVLFLAGSCAYGLLGMPISATAGFMTANVFESLACAELISRWCGPGVRFDRVREVLALLAAAVFATAVSAAVGAGTAALIGPTSFGPFWFRWWVTNGLGILLVTPLIMAWSDFRDLFHGLRWKRVLEGGLLLGMLGAVRFLTFLPGATFNPIAFRPYMLIAPLAWAGLRFGQRQVTLLMVVLAAGVSTSPYVVIGTGYWLGGTEAERLLTVQIYLAFLAGMALLLAAAYAESKSAEARVRALGDNLPLGAVYQAAVEPDGSRRFVYVSAGVETLTGVPAKEILRDASALYGLVVEEDRPALAAAEQAAIRHMTVFSAVVRLRRRDGQIRWMQLTSSPRAAGEGRIVWDGIQTDVTERKQAEEDLQAANAELTAIHAHAPVSLLVVDEEFRVQKLDGESEGTGLPPGGVLGCLKALTDPESCGPGQGCDECAVRSAVLDSLQNQSTHQNVEVWLPITLGGVTETRCFLVFTGPLQLRDSRKVLVCVLDITSRKRAELDLRNSEARFRTLTEDAPLAIGVSRQGRVIYANPTLLRMFGLRNSNELQERSALSFFAPHCREQIAERTRRRAQELPEPTEYESIGIRADGSEFPMLVAVLKMQFSEGPVMVAFITDLTAPRKAEAERAKLQHQLRQAQKLESIGRLAGGVAHDFNNLLTVINGFSALLSQKLDGQDRLWTYADQVRKAGERAAGLTRQLLTFSRQEVIEPIPLNLNSILADSEPMVRTLLGEGIELVLDLDPDLGQVMADPAQIDQVLLNLVANARDAMPRGGRLEIATQNVGGDENGGGPSVVVRFTDTGIGMDEATRQNIFEPFFTTKGVGKGTGLGLATVYGVMRQNGGWVDVKSEPGAGASFGLYFPRIENRAIAPAVAADRSRLGQGGETILLVEDEPAVRGFLRAVLEECGYKVLEAETGAAALLLAEANTDAIHLLLTDVVMPGMNGKELSERLHFGRPGLKAIFLSGYSTEVIAHSGVLDRDVAFLQKPVSPEALAFKVQEVLAGTVRS